MVQELDRLGLGSYLKVRAFTKVKARTERNWKNKIMEAARLGSPPKSGMSTACRAAAPPYRHRVRKTTNKMPAAKPVWDESRWDDSTIKRNHSGRPYLFVKRPDYPHCNIRGFAKRSHVVWWLATGQAVPEGYDVHHDNDDSLDDYFSNLRLMPHGEHSVHTKTKPRVKRVCETCGTEFEALERSVRLGNAKYCSHPCFARRVITQEQVDSMSAGVLAAFAEKPLRERRGY